MRWFRFFLLLAGLLVGLYALSMYYFVDDSTTFEVDSDVRYAPEKVFPQFSNLQNFAVWNEAFFGKENQSLEFYYPYAGKDASMSWQGRNGEGGEIFIRNLRRDTMISYQLYKNGDKFPYLINLRFKNAAENSTKIHWTIHTPHKPLMFRAANLFPEDEIAEGIRSSVAKLESILGNKVDREAQLEIIKYDSLMIEDARAQLLVGVNVTSVNRGDALQKNLVVTHGKVQNFVTGDLRKGNDEFGYPVMITDPESYREREVSYYYGVPVSKKQNITDNNFSYRKVAQGRVYAIFYEGKFSGRSAPIRKLLERARKDSMHAGSLRTTFLQPPAEGAPVRIKLELEAAR